ncbi:recombinase family protein [Corynebacterium sp. ES2715-CONJ3]|uniref:recombinase family protein n=1 Tax=Corynebacterium sp. ES2715-CONJ3 TaxID=2974028 RepID=UPI002167CD70|nr:recombinase family protein [Corynebacterium sp. ES2715-CONJ3]MCS4492584.1 recombinase family protein [Corynebacterium sp. ES2715-CONJ3]
MLIGYIRVSTAEQNPQRQIEELTHNAGTEKNFIEHLSGKGKNNRPVLNECLSYIRDGDVLIVSSIDRLARSMADLRQIVDHVVDKGAAVRFLHENLTFSADSSDPRADLMLSILGAFAEFERAIIRERQAEGIALAKKRGVYKGRKKALSAEQVEEAKRKIAAGETKAAVSRAYGIARSTLYAALSEAESE